MNTEHEPQKDKRFSAVLQFVDEADALNTVLDFWKFRDPHLVIPVGRVGEQITNLGDRTEVRKDEGGWKVYVMSNHQYLSDEAMEWLRLRGHI